MIVSIDKLENDTFGVLLDKEYEGKCYHTYPRKEFIEFINKVLNLNAL